MCLFLGMCTRDKSFFVGTTLVQPVYQRSAANGGQVRFLLIRYSRGEVRLSQIRV
jgi:hypothetical protein